MYNFYTKLHICTCLIIYLVQAQQVKDAGKIFIGVANGTAAVEYVFSLSHTSPRLPVYAVVYSGTNPSAQVARTEDVTITCDVSGSGAGYSTLSVTTTVLAVNENSTWLPLSLSASGRAVSVSCIGTSGNPCNQFCDTTSRSTAVLVRVSPRASVSICDTVYYVSAIRNSSHTFSARLSDGYVASPVDVTCTGSNTNILISNPTNFARGSPKNQIPYRVDTATKGSTSVNCIGQSLAEQFVSGSSADFVIEETTVSFKPIRTMVYNTTFSSVFSLSDTITTGVQISCQASVVSTLDQAESAVSQPNCAFISLLTTTPTSTSSTSTATTTSAPTTTTLTTTSDSTITSGITSAAPTTTSTSSTVRPTTPPDPTSPWTVTNSYFEIPSTSSPNQGKFTTVTTQRVFDPIDVRTEIVVTTCCILNTSASVQFRGKSAATYAVASLAPYMCSGCTSENVTNSDTERVFQNPGFVEVAPCACDLTQSVCDVSCCCDNDCSALDKARFSFCQPGLPGGQAAEVKDYKCSSTAFNPTDWHLVTCVYWENNGYLGMFYQNRKKLLTLDEITVEISQGQKGKFSFSETEKRYENQNSGQVVYVQGAIVKTVRADIYADDLSTGTLALSQTVPGGVCNPLAPVQFLKDSSSTCATQVTDSLCQPLSVLSSRIYAVSSTITGCSQSFKVSSTLTSNSAAEADVRYYCATNLEGYLSNAQSASPKVPDSLQLSGLNCSEPCSDSQCWQFNTGKAYQSDSTLPVRCSWDNGYTVTTPQLTSGTCMNSVLEVRYNFEWSGSTITKVLADVVLGNITVGQTVVQRFSVTWQAKTNSSVSKSDNYLGTSAPYQRSGTAGYNFGKPLSSGCTLSTPTLVDTVPEKGMAIFSPGTDGLCLNAKRRPLIFGDNVMSACSILLSFATLNDSCDSIRKHVFNQLNVLMTSNVIGRYGYNNPNDTTMWIPVLRQTLNNDTADSSNITSTTPASAQVNLTEPLWSWASAIQGVCLVPSGVHLNVMYSQTGAVNGFPRYEVIGAYVNYSQTNWTMSCSGANTQYCLNSSMVQPFYLTSSVRFIQVPLDPKPTENKFYTRCDPDNFDSDTCDRYFTTFGRGECYYDSCWQELAYPVTSLYLGESRMYTLPFFLVFVIGVIGYILVTRPGWS